MKKIITIIVLSMISVFVICVCSAIIKALTFLINLAILGGM